MADMQSYFSLSRIATTTNMKRGTTQRPIQRHLNSYSGQFSTIDSLCVFCGVLSRKSNVGQFERYFGLSTASDRMRMFGDAALLDRQ